MKRRELVKKLEAQGAVLIRHGGKHDWYHDAATKVCQPVPRHNEINEFRHPAEAFGEMMIRSASDRARKAN